MPVVGGISMGAGAAIDFTVRCATTLSGLILSPPAWLKQPPPDNLRVFPEIAAVLQAHNADRGVRLFQKSPAGKVEQETSATAAPSYLHQFRRPQSEVATRVLQDQLHDPPFQIFAQLKLIEAPTVVLGERGDRIHPFEYAVRLATAIPKER